MTIYAALAQRLGRDPTSAEIKAELTRIRLEAMVELAGKGRLPHQRKR